MNREAFEAWWDDFTSIHDDWMYADSEALRFQAWQAAVAHERKRCAGKLKIGDHVRKIKGSQWKGRIVGWYSTTLTPVGWAVESDTEVGSVQIYPESALELWEDNS